MRVKRESKSVRRKIKRRDEVEKVQGGLIRYEPCQLMSGRGGGGGGGGVSLSSFP